MTGDKFLSIAKAFDVKKQVSIPTERWPRPRKTSCAEGSVDVLKAEQTVLVLVHTDGHADYSDAERTSGLAEEPRPPVGWVQGAVGMSHTGTAAGITTEENGHVQILQRPYLLAASSSGNLGDLGA